jgi:hypothetical protein
MLSSYAGSAYIAELRSAIDRLSERLPEATWVDLQQIADERIIFRSGAEIVNFNSQIWESLVTVKHFRNYFSTRSQFRC